MAEIYTGITIQGLYSDQTGDQLFGVIGTTAPASALYLAGQDYNTGFLTALSTGANGYLNVNASIAPPSDTIATGTLTNPTDAVTISTTGTSALMVQITGAAITAGNIDFQVSLDGTTWQAANLYPVFPDGTPSASSTNVSPSNWTLFVGGVQKFRVVADGSYAGGPSTIWLTAGQGQYSVLAVSPDQANFNATVYQGTSPWVSSVTGTVAVTQSTSPWVVSGTVTANAGTGTFNVAPNNTTWTLTGTSADVNVTNTVTVTGTVSATQGTTPWVDNLTQVAGVALGATAVTAFGTAPAAANVPGTNSSIYAGTTGLTATGTSLNVNITGSSGNTTVVGTLTNNNAAPAANNVGVLPAVTVSGTFPAVTLPAITAGDQELLHVSQGGSLITIPADEEYASAISYYSAQSGTSTTTFTSTTDKPLLSIRTNSASILFLVRSLQCITDGAFASFRVFKNATLTGATFATSNGNMQIDTAATSLSAGTVVWQGFVASNPRAVDGLLDSLAAGTPGDRYTIAVTTTKAGVAANFRWSEQSAAL